MAQLSNDSILGVGSKMWQERKIQMQYMGAKSHGGS